MSTPKSIKPVALVRIRVAPGTDDECVRYDFADDTVEGGPNHEIDILGFAEFAPEQFGKIDSMDSFEGFVDATEARTRYVHWKPDLQSAVRVTGGPEVHAPASSPSPSSLSSPKAADGSGGDCDLPGRECLVSAGRLERLREGHTGGIMRVSYHAPDANCHHAMTANGLATTTVEELEELASEAPVSVSPCTYCGEGL